MPSGPRPQPRAGEKCALALVLVLVLALVFTGAASPAVAAPEELVIGYLALKKDPRYARKRTYARFLTQALGSPYPAAKVAIAESRFAGAAVGAEFKLKRRRAKSGAKLAAAALRMADAGAHYLLVDAPGAAGGRGWRAPPATGTSCCSTSLRATMCSGRRSAGPTCCT